MWIERFREALGQLEVVDLSKPALPGRAVGPLDTGIRTYEIRKFTYPPGETMHRIEMESHISTHLEAPSHYVEPRYGRPADDVASVRLERCFGFGRLLDLWEAVRGETITAEHVRAAGVASGDCVLIGNSPHCGEDRPFVSRSAAECLAELSVRLVGVDDSVFPEDPQVIGKDLAAYHLHDNLLKNDIPLIEGLANLGRLSGRPFFFWSVPAAMGGLDAFPVRAIALLEREGGGGRSRT